MLGEYKPGGQVWGAKVDRGLGWSHHSVCKLYIFLNSYLSSVASDVGLQAFLSGRVSSPWDPFPCIEVTAVLPAPRLELGFVQMAQGFLPGGPGL